MTLKIGVLRPGFQVKHSQNGGKNNLKRPRQIIRAKSSCYLKIGQSPRGDLLTHFLRHAILQQIPVKVNRNAPRSIEEMFLTVGISSSWFNRGYGAVKREDP